MRLTPGAEEILLSYEWPGNVRELRNVMERAVILSKTGEIAPEQLPADFQTSAFVQQHAPKGSGAMPSLEEIERRYAEHVVDAVDGNMSEAARILGIARNTLKAKLRATEGLSESGYPAVEKVLHGLPASVYSGNGPARLRVPVPTAPRVARERKEARSIGRFWSSFDTSYAICCEKGLYAHSPEPGTISRGA